MEKHSGTLNTNVRLLLDTHIFLWWVDDSSRLTPALRDAIKATDEVWVSMASAWECAIKVGLGKLHLPGPFDVALRLSGFQALPMAFHHFDALITLPQHHRDPFDRLLVAQARTEGLTLVSADAAFEGYDVPILRPMTSPTAL